MKELFIGVECVGMSQSVAVAANEQGEILSAVRIPHGLSLHATLRARLCKRLFELLRLLASTMRMDLDGLQRSRLCIGLTGATFSQEWQEEVPNLFSTIQFKPDALLCTGDAEIIFASHSLEEQGKAILCHSGSTAYVKSLDKQTRYGGWGPVLGDEGSCYWMGLQLLRLIAEQHDENRDSPMWPATTEWLANKEHQSPECKEASCAWRKLMRALPAGQFDTRTGIFGFSHAVNRESGLEAWRNVVASLSVPVFTAHSRHNADATRIVSAAAKHLAAQLVSACAVAELDITTGPLVLYGGAFNHHPEFRCEVQKCLSRAGFPSTEAISNSHPGSLRPACGALLFAMNGSSKLRLPPTPLLRNVVRTAADHAALTND
jgi:N-acetylglucosamine kinase-like BadF-type ATPase